MFSKLNVLCSLCLLCLLCLLCSLAIAQEKVAAHDDAAGEILEVTGTRGGLIVHLGCGDGRLTAALGAGEGYLVHGLDSDPANVEAARRYAAQVGLSGKVAVDRLPKGHLPYVDNLVRLLVVENPTLLPEGEMMRVLAPGGTAYIRSGDRWRKAVKPWPEEIDADWAHYLRGPDNNAVARDSLVGPPRQVQWLAGPRWTRNHHTLNSVSSAVTADGRLFYIADEASPANIHLPPRWNIIARDAFSGVTLWTKPMHSWVDHRHRFRTGPPQAPRLLVASADRLYTTLELGGPVVSLDTTTGEVTDTFRETAGAEEIILAGRTLLVLAGSPEADHAFSHPAARQRQAAPNEKTLLAIDASTGKTLWQWTPEGHPVPKTLASDGTSAYLRIGDGTACLDMQSGEERWRWGDWTPAPRVGVHFGTHTLVVADDVVVFNVRGELVAVEAGDGSTLWRHGAGSSFHAPPDVFVIGDLVWHKFGHRADSPPPIVPTPEIEALDLRTGEVRVQDPIADQIKTAGHHYRCYRAKATERFVIAGKRGVEMIDLAGEEHSRNNWVRGACQYGVLPANGLLYVPPHSCGCYMETMLHGFWAFTAAPPSTADPRYSAAAAARLEKGRAYGQVDATLAPGPECWPTYRADPLRRAAVATAVPARLRQAWQATVGGRLTQPVVAAGHVVAADIEGGIVVALDEASGEVQWKHVAGGRVDSPPTIHEGLVLFGSADGRVTCLRLNDGALVWRFLAAPADLRTVAMDRLESPWPVHGSVLVLDGVAYCSAGRSSWLDGGIHLFGLEPATGRVVHHARYESRRPEFHRKEAPRKEPGLERIEQNITDYKTFEHPDRADAFSMAGGAVSDVLVSDGRNVFLRHRKFNAALEKQEEHSRHLFSTSSLLDDAENHRSHWVLGTGDFSRIPVAYSWIVNNKGGRRGASTVAVPTGVVLAYNDHAVWGVQRPEQGQAAVGEYLLFKMDNEPFRPGEPSLPDFRNVSPREYVYRVPLPGRGRAILQSGEHLFVAVMPTDRPDDDPHASYDGRRGGAVLVCSEEDGAVLARLPLDSPAVWDGVAAANGRLYIATQDGRIVCLNGG